MLLLLLAFKVSFSPIFHVIMYIFTEKLKVHLLFSQKQQHVTRSYTICYCLPVSAAENLIVGAG